MAVFPNPVHPADCSHVLTALARVDEVYQAAVALFYLEDYSYKEIAAILELPVGTVKSRISRGIAQLRKILMPNDEEDSQRRHTNWDRSPIEDQEPVSGFSLIASSLRV